MKNLRNFNLTVRQRRGPERDYGDRTERWERTGKTWCHRAKEKGLPERGGSQQC